MLNRISLDFSLFFLLRRPSVFVSLGRAIGVWRLSIPNDVSLCFHHIEPIFRGFSGFHYKSSISWPYQDFVIPERGVNFSNFVDTE